MLLIDFSPPLIASPILPLVIVAAAYVDADMAACRAMLIAADMLIRCY